MMAEPEEQHKSTEPVDEKDYEKRKWDIRVYTQADKELSEAELAKLRDLQHSTDNHPVTPVLFEPKRTKNKFRIVD